MESPQGKTFLNHDWFVAAITFIAAVAVNVVIYAYGQGKQEHRIETLEKQMVDMRDDWRLARDRIERELRDRK